MLSHDEQRLLASIDHDELVTLLRELVRRPSENPPGNEGQVAEFLAVTCEQLGFRTSLKEVAAGRPNVCASIGPAGGEGLLLLGHTDTVPAGEGWTHPPFDPRLLDGRVFGRGAADMKAGIAAAVIAMAALQRCQVPLAAPVTLAAVIDEEESGKGIRALLDADPPRAQAAIVAEPTELQTIIACRGNCYVEVCVRGRSAHAGSPREGANAIYGGARVVEAIRGLHDEIAGQSHALLGPGGWSVGLIRGGTGTAMVPDRCVISIDARLLPGQTGEQARERIERLVAGLALDRDGLSATSELLMEIPSFELASDHPLVTSAVNAAVDAGAPDRPVDGWSAACDGGFLVARAGIPSIVLGPGSVVDQAHRPDESVAVAEVATAARAYALIAARMLGHRTTP